MAIASHPHSGPKRFEGSSIVRMDSVEFGGAYGLSDDSFILKLKTIELWQSKRDRR